MRVLAALLLAYLIVPAPSPAATYVVDPQGTGDFPTIQAAVDACGDGDVVELTDGTFTGPGNRDIRFAGLSLTLRSQSGDPTRTIIDCENVARGFSLPYSVHVVFEGMTMTRGRAPDWGGAVTLGTDGWATFRTCIFTDNSAPGNAGAVMIESCAFAEFEGCTFIGNSSVAGGAVCT